MTVNADLVNACLSYIGSNLKVYNGQPITESLLFSIFKEVVDGVKSNGQ